LPTGALITPLTQFPTLHLTKEQILTLSPADLKIAIFSQLTGAIYDQGLDQAANSFTSDPQAQQTFVQQASPLGLITKERHELLQRITLILGVISLLWLALLVLFSAGWGRLVSPATVLLLVSPIGAVIGLVILGLSQGDGPLSSLAPTSLVSSVGNDLRQSYGLAAVIGVVLLIVAAIGKVIQSIVRRHAERPAFLKS